MSNDAIVETKEFQPAGKGVYTFSLDFALKLRRIEGYVRYSTSSDADEEDDLARVVLRFEVLRRNYNPSQYVTIEAMCNYRPRDVPDKGLKYLAMRLLGWMVDKLTDTAWLKREDMLILHVDRAVGTRGTSLQSYFKRFGFERIPKTDKLHPLSRRVNLKVESGACMEATVPDFFRRWDDLPPLEFDYKVDPPIYRGVFSSAELKRVYGVELD